MPLGAAINKQLARVPVRGKSGKAVRICYGHATVYCFTKLGETEVRTQP